MTRNIRPIRIEGKIAFVALMRGYEAIIDAEDVPLVDGWNWRALVNRHTVYAYREERLGDGKRRTVYLHREILCDPASLQVDHIDTNGLNNQRANLRVATIAQNQHNSRRPKHNTSGFKGVSWSNSRAEWRAQIMLDGKQRHLGYYPTPGDAHVAYCEASARLHGDFGRTE
jgi:hypothetical protein